MTVDEARRRNQEKAEAQAEHGPVREDPTTSPIGDAIQDFHTRGDLAFGIPAQRTGCAVSAEMICPYPPGVPITAPGVA